MEKQLINESTASPQEIADAKRFKRIKLITPLKGVLEGSAQTLDGSYLNYFLTDIYLLPVAFTGVLSAFTIILAWIVGPLFGAFSDNFKFKKSKFWPWPVIAFTLKYILLTTVFILPSVADLNRPFMAPLIFVLVLLGKLSDKIGNIPISGVAPLVTSSQTERQTIAQLTKIGHEGGKTIWGYFGPLVLAMFTTLAAGNRITGFAYTALLLYPIGWLGPFVYAFFGLRGSYVERKGLENTQAKQNKKVPVTQTLKVLFTNRPALGMFLFYVLHKIYFFIYTIYGISVYDHIFGNADGVGTYLTVLSGCSIAGVMCGKLWTRIFKDSKRSCATAMLVHILFTIAIALTFNIASITVFLILFGCSSFFMGMLETWITPLFTSCAEYGNWKTGVSMNALVLSVYPLCVTTGMAMPPIIATMLLKPESYNQGLTVLFVWVPVILAIAALLSLLFIFNLNDAKIAKIQEDLKNGKTQATSDLKL